MDGLYNAITDAKHEAEGNTRPNKELMLRSYNGNVWMDAYFDGKNSVAKIGVEVHTKRMGALSEILSNYWDGPVLFTMRKHAEELFKIHVRPAGSIGGLTKVSENMNKDEANALMEVLDVLGITYERKNDGGPSFDPEKRYKKITPELVEKTLGVMDSRQQYHSYIFASNWDLKVGVDADGDKILVNLWFGKDTPEAQIKNKIDMLQSLIEKDPECGCNGFELMD